MIPDDLRLTLLWWFGTTDPELLHEVLSERANDQRPQASYQDMLARSAQQAGPNPTAKGCEP